MWLEDHIARRKEINRLYRTLLQDMPGIAFHTNPNEDFDSNYWLTCIVVNAAVTGFTREELRLRMEQENIETRPLWKPMHLQPVFADCPYYGDNTEGRLFDDGLLPAVGSCAHQRGTLHALPTSSKRCTNRHSPTFIHYPTII